MADHDDDDFSGSGDVQTRRLVISIDFGTTYTGIAYATPLGHNSALKDIDVVIDWGERMDSIEKIPSVISYSQRSRGIHEANWGSDLAPGAVAMKHMKLRLDPQDVSDEIHFLLQLLDGTRDLTFENIKDSKGMPDYTDRSPEEVVTDYLSNVADHVLQTVGRFTDQFRRTIPVDLVITIPVGWSYRAKNSTYRAIRKAGFNNESFPMLKDTMFITEPEAAAVYTARYFDEMNEQFLKKGECFILVDAGGGTVDIVSYQVESLEPLKLVPVGVPTGGRCGSIFIDQAFKDWLRDLLTDEYYLQLDPDADLNNMYGIECEAIRKIMSEFDTIKREFHKESGDMFLDLPEPLNNLTLPGRVDGGQVTITNEEMREFFNPRIDDIIEMVKYHIREIENHGSRVKNLFLIGGFGESEFLKQELSDSLFRRDGKELRVPDTSWTAVARGAVLCGVEKLSMDNLTRTTCSERSYGIAVDESYSYANDERDLARHPETGKMIAKAQMKWLVNKGDLITSDEATVKEHKFVVRFKEDEIEKMKGTVQIYSWAEDKHRPTRLLNAVKELQRENLLKYDFSSCPLTDFARREGHDRHTYHYVANLTLRLSISMDSPRLRAELLWKNGKPVPTTSAMQAQAPRSFSNPTAGLQGLRSAPSVPVIGASPYRRRNVSQISNVEANMRMSGQLARGDGSRSSLRVDVQGPETFRRPDRSRLSVQDTDMQGLERWA